MGVFISPVKVPGAQVSPVTLSLLPCGPSPYFLKLFLEGLGCLLCHSRLLCNSLTTVVMEVFSEASTQQTWCCGKPMGPARGTIRQLSPAFDPTVAGAHKDAILPLLAATIAVTFPRTTPEVPLSCLNCSARKTKCFCAFGSSPKANTKQPEKYKAIKQSRVAFQKSQRRDVGEVLSFRLH